MSKKEIIKNGENVSIDNDNIIVLNNVSVAEKEEKQEEKQEEPVAAASEEPKAEVASNDNVSDSQTNEEQQEPEVSAELPKDATPEPQIDVPAIDIPALDSTAIPTDVNAQMPAPSIDMPGVTTQISNPFNTGLDNYPQNNFASDNSQNNFATDNFQNNFATDFNIPNQLNNNPMYAQDNNAFATDFSNLNGASNIGGNNSVFKTESDVDKAFNDFIKDVSESYSERISDPTKALVTFINKFVKWGDEVTKNGLNRGLFDEYDRLMDELNSIKSYNEFNTDDNVYNENKSLTNFGDEEENNNYGGMVA